MLKQDNSTLFVITFSQLFVNNYKSNYVNKYQTLWIFKDVIRAQGLTPRKKATQRNQGYNIITTKKGLQIILQLSLKAYSH